jgi:hypothetical protein
VAAPGLTLADTQLIGGRSFRRYTGNIPAGGVISVRLPGPPRTPALILGVLVGVVALALLLGGWYLVSRAPRESVRAPAAAPADGLLNRLAALDARYLGREGEVDPGEWAGYQADRARLKGELQAWLAARGSV